jgi:hypothetical protein
MLHRADLVGLLKQLQDEKLLIINNTDLLRMRLTLTSAGWRRVDEIQRQGVGLSRSFVAMWFSADVRPAYEEGIRPALVECGYVPPFRVDDAEHEEIWKTSAEDGRRQQKIDDRILGEIRRSRFLVADFTGQRPSVYFEAGFAEGLGIP